MVAVKILLALSLITSVAAQPPKGGPKPPPKISPSPASAPTGTGETCDPCGSDAEYLEEIVADSGYVKRQITASFCPNHYSYCTGKDFGVCGSKTCTDGSCVGTEGSDTEAKDVGKTFDIPAQPVFSGSTTDVSCQLGTIGLAMNGVPIFSMAVNGACDPIDVEVTNSEWTGFDFCGGHTAPGGIYHYHFPPCCLLAQAEMRSSSTPDMHSPQLGWALDGFPIYGPKGPGGIVMEFSSQGCTGAYCLDQCSGLLADLPNVDGFKYRYYFSGECSDLTSLPVDPRPSTKYAPFSFGCYKGCLFDDLAAGTCSGAAGTTSGFIATVTEGITSRYVSPAATDKKCYDASLIETAEPTLSGVTTNQPVTTRPPTNTPTRTPTRAPTTGTGTVDCSGIPDYKAKRKYRKNNRVKYGNQLYKSLKSKNKKKMPAAKWWALQGTCTSLTVSPSARPTGKPTVRPTVKPTTKPSTVVSICGNMEGSWKAKTRYNVENIVYFKNSLYRAILVGKSKNPKFQSAYWELISAPWQRQATYSEGEYVQKKTKLYQSLRDGNKKKGLSNKKWWTLIAANVLKC